MKRKVLWQCVEDAIASLNKHPDPKGYQHFSYIVQNNSIIGKGYNRISSPLPGYPSYGKLHSEPDAFAQCRGIMDKSSKWSMVNIRLSKAGELKISKPCKCCYSFLRRLDCKEVWFTTGCETNLNGFAKIVF